MRASSRGCRPNASLPRPPRSSSMDTECVQLVGGPVVVLSTHASTHACCTAVARHGLVLAAAGKGTTPVMIRSSFRKPSQRAFATSTSSTLFSTSAAARVLCGDATYVWGGCEHVHRCTCCDHAHLRISRSRTHGSLTNSCSVRCAFRGFLGVQFDLKWAKIKEQKKTRPLERLWFGVAGYSVK